MTEKENNQNKKKRDYTFLYVLTFFVLGIYIGYRYGFNTGYNEGGDFVLELVADSLNISLGD